ncbi:SRPBCC family protein [Tenacibaculum xiamenense]|uniref:SRPBCC family protein n=1 Tax=Tenacibaculum xiamenense TaxID=1261553 RepID=UPI0038940CA5
MNTYLPIIVEEYFETSLSKVWHAITDLKEMKQWYFEQITAFKAEKGFETAFEVHIEDRTFTHLWTIQEVIPFQKIRYQWRYKEYTGDSQVVFELKEIDEKVLLIVTAEYIEDFPKNIPEFKRESGVQGWNYLIKESLKKHLEKVSNI